MKKLITSAGLVALSATGLEAAYAPGLGEVESSKLMTYSVTTRGFYDDNITTLHSNPNSAFGFDLRPSAIFNLTSLPQTFIKASYTYDLRYFFDRQPHAADHSHEFALKAEHAFSERYKLSLDESFVYSQEPEVIGDVGIVIRTPASAYRNVANAKFTSRLTESLGTRLVYENTWTAYSDSGPLSRAARLDRTEHEVRAEGTWVLDPKLVARLGYRLSVVGYTGSLVQDNLGGLFQSDLRDQTRHTVYLGADYEFSARLKASAEAGAATTVYSSQLNVSSLVSPYASANLTYVYAEKSYLQTGVSMDRTPTDLVGDLVNGITSDVERLSPFVGITHQITPRITGGAVVRYSHYTYTGGRADGESENFLSPQLNIDYKINQFLMATATYNYDRLMGTDTPGAPLANRSFTRNRVFLGLTATY